MRHTCSTMDPRCDQGHFGPHFMTWHRTFLLWGERSLLAIDPSIGGAPYWDLTKDAKGADGNPDGAYRNDADLYIFTDNWFGDYMPATPEKAVRNGMFANWTVSVFNETLYGTDGKFAAESTCLANGYFQPVYCVDNDETSPRFIRTHGNDCSPVESAMNNCYRNCLGGTAHIYLCWNLTYSSQNQNRAGKSVTNTLHQQA